MISLEKIENIVITDFSAVQTVNIKFRQTGTLGRYFYRLKCEPYKSTIRPTLYIYLGTFDSSPQWIYTNVFPISRITDETDSETDFETLFETYPEVKKMPYVVTLQSSPSGSFVYIDSSETRLIDISIDGDNFKPTWQIPSWVDGRHSITGLLAPTDQEGVQGKSRFDFQYTPATPKYGASIEEYSINMVGGYSATFTPSQLSAMGYEIPVNMSGFKNLSGDITTIFTVTDSRGFSTSFSAVITVIPYKAVYLNINNTHRLGQTRSTVILDFSGTWYGSPLSLVCNGIKAFAEGQSTPAYSLTPQISVSNTGFSYKVEWQGATFDVDTAYTITAEFTDGISTVNLKMPIPTATPAIAIRYNKVGINKSSDPDYELDVSGTIAQNAFPVLGFAGTIGDAAEADLNDYVDTGYYYYDGSSANTVNFPSNVNLPCMLTVISVGQSKVQRLTVLTTGADHVRAYNGSWGAWR